MRHMRLLVFLLLLCALLGALTGCGGGGGNTRSARRKVTIALQSPTGARKTSRVPIQSLNSTLVEIYDGTQRIGVVKLTGQNGTTLDLPLKPLTFYANGFAEATAPDYVTNPANGQLDKGSPGALVPLVVGDSHPVAHAVSVVDVAALPNPPIVKFTWNNTITTLVPTNTTFYLDQGTVDLNQTLQAKTADGAIVMTGTATTSVYQWVVDPSDTLGALRATVDQTTNPARPVLNLLHTGTVRLIVTDNEVNSPAYKPEFGQQPLTATITYTILDKRPQQTLTLNTAPGSQLAGSVPFYAKSITLTLSQDPLVDPNTNPQVLDNPPPPINAGPFVVTPAFAANQSINGVSLPAIAIPFTPTGRTLTLTVNAWSRPDGTGALLAQQTLLTLAPVSATLEVTLALRVTGFALTPANPTVNVSNTTPAAVDQNTLRLQVTAAITGDATPFPIDPRALSVTTGDANVTASYPATPLDSSGNPYLLLTFNPANVTPRPVTITVSDGQKTGTTTVTINSYTPGFIFH